MTISAAVTRIIERRENATAKVDAAIRRGRLARAQRHWAIGYCSRDPGGFAKFISVSPVMATSPDGSFIATISSPRGLTQTELIVAQRLGISAEQFVRGQAAQKTKHGQWERKLGEI